CTLPASLSRTNTPYPLSRSGRPCVGVPDQPHDTARVHHLSALSPTMAGGAVLQVDQTTPAHQAVLRHVGERGEDASLDRRQHVRACRYRPKASGLTVVAAFDAANSQRHTI